MKRNPYIQKKSRLDKLREIIAQAGPEDGVIITIRPVKQGRQWGYKIADVSPTEVESIDRDINPVGK